MSQARKDLEAYAKEWDLQVFEGHDECALQMDVDPDDARETCGGDIEAIACYPDHVVFQVCAYIVNGTLYRFGIEMHGEDPGECHETSLKELEALGDPHKRW